MFDNIESFLTQNSELAWIAIFVFAFMESFILSGLLVSSVILFSVCVFVFNMEILPLYAIVPIAILGAHSGDMSGFYFGKTVGSKLLQTKFLKKREKTINRAQRFLDKTGSYTVITGRFIPAVRPIVPFLLGISDVKPVRFFIAESLVLLLYLRAILIIPCLLSSITLKFNIKP